MKKLLFFGFTLVAAVSVNAQVVKQRTIHPEDQMTINKGVKSSKTVGKREMFQGKYIYMDAFKEERLLGDPSYTRWWIGPDTNAVMVYSDGASNNVDVHTIGSCFDPKDSGFLSASQQVLTRFNGYSVDTVSFYQTYVRGVDSILVNGVMTEVVDTAYVQYFDINSMKVTAFSYQNDKASRWYGTPKTTSYNPANLLNTAAIKTDTILLTKDVADSLDVQNPYLGAHRITFTPNLTIKGINAPFGAAQNAANTFAFNVVYRPMAKPKLNDTIINWSKTGWSHKANGYAVTVGYWSGTKHESFTPYRINNTFWTIFPLLSGATYQIFQGYLPTSIYNTGFLMYNEIDITTDNMKTNETVAAMSSVSVAPNPVTSNDAFAAYFGLKQASEVSAVIYDINGREVKSFENRFFLGGVNHFDLNTTGLTSGVYTVRLTSAAGAQSAKFIVQ